MQMYTMLMSKPFRAVTRNRKLKPMSDQVCFKPQPFETVFYGQVPDMKYLRLITRIHDTKVKFGLDYRSPTSILVAFHFINTLLMIKLHTNETKKFIPACKYGFTLPFNPKIVKYIIC